MKKLLLILLIFALFLTGCNTLPTAENSDDSLLNEENGESSKNEQEDGAPEKNEGNNHQTVTPLRAGTYEWAVNKKPSIHPISNANNPQDESADFLYVFNVEYGDFERGKGMELKVDLINNTGATHTYDGSSSYRASVKLFCITNGEEYVLEHELVAETADSGTYYDIEAGKSSSWIYYYNIPEDAPAGEYTLVCWYQTTRTEFDGYFTLTQ